jgi:hypothetical protein
MGRSKFDQNARRIAVMGLAARSLAPVVRDALRDRRVRSALDDTYGSGRRVYAEVRGSEPKDVASRVARDEDLQAELAALVRSAARAFDEGVSATKRRASRRLVWVAAVAGGVLAIVGIRRRRGDGQAGDGLHDGLNHGLTDTEIVNRVATPAGRGVAEQ